jgi:hypothetical protein
MKTTRFAVSAVSTIIAAALFLAPSAAAAPPDEGGTTPLHKCIVLAAQLSREARPPATGKGASDAAVQQSPTTNTVRDVTC